MRRRWHCKAERAWQKVKDAAILLAGCVVVLAVSAAAWSVDYVCKQPFIQIIAASVRVLLSYSPFPLGFPHNRSNPCNPFLLRCRDWKLL